MNRRHLLIVSNTTRQPVKLCTSLGLLGDLMSSKALIFSGFTLLPSRLTI